MSQKSVQIGTADSGGAYAYKDFAMLKLWLRPLAPLYAARCCIDKCMHLFPLLLDSFYLYESVLSFFYDGYMVSFWRGCAFLEVAFVGSSNLSRCAGVRFL